MIKFTNMEAAGLLPMMFDENDLRPAREQADANYQHGGGWHPFEGFQLYEGHDGTEIQYPGDLPSHEVSRAVLHDETIILFEYSWVAIVQPDGSHEISRMD